ncbi:3-methyl-2-oxobutanoate hydroxymethyltransferase [Brevundimonas sp.]|uniref:3-methyl-2-oxobutanoate hydroxymethyltransferase n=1 Tax=Brevundimonas sp. TaxID=1871086 RepID=UPI001DDFDBC4|nr:3-methyl-2-oxobutanoate hydroxymethyltransferase [Brevundimonas sp.]MBA4000554.1 3-methyl-2-oxobutanoate hydroxymethyltransferase [Brevundimonas sp.]
MSSQKQEPVKRLHAPDILARKGGEPIVCLTAYDAPTAEMLDEHCDLLLVGDSVGMVVHGLPNTVGVTLDMMILHGQAVMRGARQAMVVIDMPFGSYEGGKELAYQNCARVMKETGAQGVKLESGPTVPQTIEYLVQRGIPVMGHVGLRPQAVLNEGGFKAKGKTEDERIRVMSEAEATADAGAFAVVIEGVAEGLAAEITLAIDKPTIGIGASAACDGQILVVNDMLGMFDWSPKFVRRYADLRGEITRAAKSYAEDVRARRFPAQVETYFSKKPV